MNSRYYKFYFNKLKIIGLMIGFVLLLIFPFFQEPDSKTKIFRVLVFCFNVPVLIFLWITLFSGKPYIEITPLFIRVGRDKIGRSDVIGVRKEEKTVRGTTHCSFVLEIKNYQKYEGQYCSSNVYIDLSLLCKKDREKLKLILKECFPESQLD